MNKNSVDIIQGSFEQLVPIADQVDAMFNARLLDTHPEVYRIFVLDVEPHARKLVQALAPVVRNLNKVGGIRPAMRELAHQQKVYRVAETYYQAIEATLIWTLRRSLGASFTGDVERAWINASGADRTQ